MSRTLALVTLVVLLAAAPAGAHWVRKASFGGYGALEGSALCAGAATEADGVTRNCVWMLHGWSWYFQRFYDNAEVGQWDLKSQLPSGPNRPYVYPGGALAYVPDPYACPPNGWVFAFPGSMSSAFPSREFYVYHPGEGPLGTWYSAPSIPESESAGVTGGAALCYGGMTEIGGRSYAAVYAFTGQETDLGGGNWSGHFFRYVFELVPYDNGAPEHGYWEELTPVPDKVEPGAALTWLPNPVTSNPHVGGWVIAMTAGNTSQSLWRYDATAPLFVWTGVNPALANHEGPGACLTTRDGGSSVMLLYGGGKDEYSLCQPAEPQDPGWIVTRYNPPDPDGNPTHSKAGGAVARIGNVTYAEFGLDNVPWFWAFYDDPVSGGSGGQGGGGVGRPALRVAVRSTRGQSDFTVHCQPGPVSLKLVNSAGAVVSTVKAEARSGLAELTWPHGSSASGIYLYVVSTRSGVATGKVTVMK
jgi:hypothetical protein